MSSTWINSNKTKLCCDLRKNPLLSLKYVCTAVPKFLGHLMCSLKAEDKDFRNANELTFKFIKIMEGNRLLQ
jgi:hypothetical protein